MDLFPALTSFYETIEDDPRIGATHISLYMALLQQWNINAGARMFVITRRDVMKAAKISARQTYNKCINQLHNYGYIIYTPSFGNAGSTVIIRKLC